MSTGNKMTMEEAKVWTGRHINSLRIQGVTPALLEKLSSEGNEKAIEVFGKLHEVKDLLGFTTLDDMFSYCENRLREIFNETK